MATHHKPTKEELQAGMQKSLEDLKNLPPEGTPPATPPAGDPPAGDPPATPPAGDPPATPPKKEGEEPPATPPAGDPPATPPENETPEQKIARLEKERDDAKKEADDAKKKFSTSSREAQLIGLREKALLEAQEQADALPDPTDDEMKALYPNWDEIDQINKDLAKERVLSKKRKDLLATAREKFKNVQEWAEKVTAYVTNPQTLIDHPELEGKEDEFKDFASKGSRRGLEFEDLVLAFRGELANRPPSPNKGKQMFEPGGSRAPTPPAPKDDKLSPAEGEALRKTDYKKYVQMLKAGKIRNL